jgi:hypothetical protein
VQAPAAGSASKVAAGADARTALQERPGAAGSTSMGAESGMRGRFAGEGSGGFQQLEQDHAARFGGAERQRQYGAMEGGRFGGGGAGRRR